MATPAKKSPAAKTVGAPTGFNKPLTPSAELAAIIGSEAIPRTEVTKKIWEYIKANDLQDPANKRNINADAKLKPIFGKAQVTMFEMTKLLSAHLS
jgi:chromatin remodeling complex protein RSC6